jgi:pimeloyl-ACP methyl ester carboxylesterase
MSHWLVERMFSVLGLEAVFPGAMGPLLEMGFKYSDLVDVVEAIDALALMPSEWLRKGAFHEAAAREAEDAGELVTACELYHRAALSFARARWGMAAKTAEMGAAYEALTSNYDAACRLLSPALGRTIRITVEVPAVGSPIGGILHLPPLQTTAEPPPVVLIYPGMDMAKEYFPGLLSNPLTRRGLAALTIDPPGHGQSLAEGIHLTLGNVEATGSAFIDALAERVDVDGRRVAVMGVSFGSYFAMSHATVEPRISAVAAFQGGVFYDKRRFLAAMPPTFNSRLRAMTAIDDDAEFEAFAESLSLEGRESQITCPSLIVTGEWDELNSLPLSRHLHATVSGPSKLVVYEGQGRLLGGVTAEATARTVDWLAKTLRGHSVEPVAEWVPSWKRTDVSPRL